MQRYRFCQVVLELQVLVGLFAEDVGHVALEREVHDVTHAVVSIKKTIADLKAAHGWAEENVGENIAVLGIMGMSTDKSRSFSAYIQTSTQCTPPSVSSLKGRSFLPVCTLVPGFAPNDNAQAVFGFSLGASCACINLPLKGGICL